MLDREAFEVLWSAMAESALEIEGLPFAKDTALDRALTKGKLSFLAVGIADGTVDPEEPTGPIVPEDQTSPTEPTAPVDADKQSGDANRSTSTPQTGDSSNPIAWLGVLLAAATAATAAVAYGCRRKGGR